MESFTLGIVDQSPVRQGGTVRQALQESVELAKIAEKLGYKRYWVAEHHNAGRFAGTAPEILIGQIAANTQTIRVGSGGVMLPHYAAFKVAETFSLLNSFYPDRISLGLGRAPGSDQSTAVALAYPRMPIDPQHFPRQVSDVLGFLTGTLPESHPFAQVQSQPGPVPESIPEVWLLGSSDYSAQLAGVMGLPFSFAEFFGFTGGHGPQVADLYRERFHPSEYLEQPRINVSVQVICAESKERAEFIATSRNLSRLDSLQGDRKPLPSPEEASQVKLHRVEEEHLAKYTQHVIQGDSEEVKLGIMDAAKRYSTRDINIVTNCYYFEDRVRSYELIAEAFDLANSNN
ncbi:MAG: LLM class flavin-dependent oxidoreductase [Dehalococcoidia bacterium]|nr:LLM class flavin-dependent oxidoreductase [Dehalococcoidia bacterium]